MTATTRHHAARRFGVLLLAAALAGCASGGRAAPGPDTLATAPERVTILGRDYTLETYLWRDFMPGPSPARRGLIALVWLTAADGRPVDHRLVLDGLWLVRGGEVVPMQFSDEVRYGEPRRRHQLERIARDGPRWPTGIEVDVIVRVRDATGRSYWLKAKRQPIHRTV